MAKNLGRCAHCATTVWQGAPFGDDGRILPDGRAVHDTCAPYLTPTPLDALRADLARYADSARISADEARARGDFYAGEYHNGRADAFRLAAAALDHRAEAPAARLDGCTCPTPSPTGAHRRPCPWAMR